MQQAIKATPKKKSIKNKLTVQHVEMKTTLSDGGKPTEVPPTMDSEKSIDALTSKKRKQEEKLTKLIAKENIFKTHMSEVENKLNEMHESRKKRRKKSKEEPSQESMVLDVKYDDITSLKVIPEDVAALENTDDALAKKKNKVKNKVTSSLQAQQIAVPNKFSKSVASNKVSKSLSNKLSKPLPLSNNPSKEDVEKYPILKNEELINKFLQVTMTNNQKGRIRQVLKDLLKGTTSVLLPEVIHTKILSILKSSENLTDTELRKIRILYNMLRTAIEAEKTSGNEKVSDDKKKKKKKSGDELKEKVPKEKVPKEKVPKEKVPKEKDEKEQVNKVKGPKRYVVFVGNLPLDINKEKILTHFSEFKECIKDIRIPHRTEDKKSAIAYLELMNEPTYELALSKHHSMFGSKRINVLYTTQKNGKITKASAKSKSAKLQAMLRSGQLLGSVPLNRKRSHRRAKLKQARRAAENNQ